MKQAICLGVFALIFMLSAVFTVGAKDIVVNDGFGNGTWDKWTSFGNLHNQWIDYYNTSGTGASLCVANRASTSNNGGLQQSVFVIQGVTYDITVDFAYSNC